MIPDDLVLEGDRVRLEPLAHSHAADLHATFNDPALWEFTYQINPLSTLRHVTFFSIIASGWPATKARLEALLGYSMGKNAG